LANWKWETGIADEQKRAFVKTALANLFDHGHLTGSEKNGEMQYNLSKITLAKDVAANPDV